MLEMEIKLFAIISLFTGRFLSHSIFFVKLIEFKIVQGKKIVQGN